ncbi:MULTISPECIES: hypothetical protein [unclassified Herbaspirillum]|uniref:hypothetical protein n=1 Tax=unclassified Herbaspirillum TaxID=2624150 RepID=UPI0011518637|nr:MULTISPECIES: hypothetical protein [unclassified Herbaspirillum]MBB5393110.1 osmotically inducible lipoprotein OsmE [Herbaspirillum sp. SJZ102]
MHRFAILALAAATLAGCGTMHGNFVSDPVASTAFRANTTKQNMLDLRQPAKRTPVRNGTSECFDYELDRMGRRTDFYVGFTSSGKVNAAGYTNCAAAIAAGHLNSDAPAKQIY